MGIFDKIKGMVGSEDLDYNEYEGDLFGDDMPGMDPMADTQGAQNGYDAGYAAFDPQPQPQPIPVAPAPEAPGSAGSLKLYNVDPKTAAMLMAIVADKMGKPINELRFISIKEVSK